MNKEIEEQLQILEDIAEDNPDMSKVIRLLISVCREQQYEINTLDRYTNRIKSDCLNAE